MSKPVLILLIFVFIATSSANEAEQSATTKIFPKLFNTKNGPIQGIVGKSRNESKPYVGFLGLRYADMPARFQPASALTEKWNKPKLADKPGSMCPQFAVGYDAEFDEDCLFLNVYVPKSHLEKDNAETLPVMVWIHGGGFNYGDGYNYGPDYFMETEEVILVTLNYRLGALGFLTTEDDILLGNNGLRDQVMALKWVKENIVQLKGNPKNVTVFGNSAGSASIHYLLMSPRARGLFQKAIMQSGAFSFWSFDPNPKETAVKFATHMGCSLDSDDEEQISWQIRRCLEKKSVGDIIVGQLQFQPRWPEANVLSRFLPTAAEKLSHNPFFAGHPQSFFTKGKKNTAYASKVPVLTGVTRSEGSTFYTAAVLKEERLVNELNLNWDQIAPKTFFYDTFYPVENQAEMSSKIRKFYFGNKQELSNREDDYWTRDTLAAIYSDTMFVLPVMAAAKEMAAEGLKVYPYMFAFRGRWTLRSAIGFLELPGMIGHADELQYLFPHPILGAPLEPDSIEEKFSRYFVKYWIHFAKHGKPTTEFVVGGEEILWKPLNKYRSKTAKETYTTNFDVLRLDTKPKVINYEFSDRLKFWQELSEANFDVSVGSSSIKTEL